MGVFKKFIGGLALESMQTATTLNENQNITCISYKNMDGTNRTVIGFHGTSFSPSTTYTALASYGMLTPQATADELTNYDLFDYQIEGVCSTTLTSRARTISVTHAITILGIHIENDTQESVTVKCIKFYKPVPYDRFTSGVNTLICGYYLDNPITLNPGDTVDISISLKVGTDVSVNET